MQVSHGSLGEGLILIGPLDPFPSSVMSLVNCQKKLKVRLDNDSVTVSCDEKD